MFPFVNPIGRPGYAIDPGDRARLPHVAVVGRAGLANAQLVEAWRHLGIDAGVVTPHEALHRLHPDDVAIVRLDVLETLDGIEPGLDEIRELQHRGLRIVNRPAALAAVHDKLETARLLDAALIPHPRTAHVRTPNAELPLTPPLVIKPRHGSWGRDVFRCESIADAESCLRTVADRPWFVRHGALVQELVVTGSSDLRILVAEGCVIGAARRTAASGEWRTNVSLGGRLEHAEPDRHVCELARAAVAATGSDFVGIDLLEGPSGWLVLELNGAVDFDARYSVGEADIYRALADALELCE
jgi:RimK family alpha-L-glutamate ligase